MKATGRQRISPEDRQRKLLSLVLLRSILISMFIGNLLIAYKLIRPDTGQQIHQTLSLASLAPILRGSVLFFLLMSALSLVAFMLIQSQTERALPKAHTPAEPENSIPVHTGRIIVFRPGHIPPADMPALSFNEKISGPADAAIPGKN